MRKEIKREVGKKFNKVTKVKSKQWKTTILIFTLNWLFSNVEILPLATLEQDIVL